MAQTPSFSFSAVDVELSSLATSEAKEQLLQYNLDQGLTIHKFRFTGNLSSSSSDYDLLLKDFFSSAICTALLQVHGTASLPFQHNTENLSVSVMNMEFFDKIVEGGIAGESGNIRGCYDEIFDGVTVSDKLRELLLNEDSENASVFNDADRKEFIFQLFRIFAVGGALCQPDTNLNRYLNLTKAFYKDLVTIFKDPQTEKAQIAGRAYKVSRVDGLQLFPSNPSSPHNAMLVLVDPLKRLVTVVKNSFMPFW